MTEENVSARGLRLNASLTSLTIQGENFADLKFRSNQAK